MAAPSWQEIVAQQAEEMSSRLRDVLSAGVGLLRTELGLQLPPNLEPQRLPTWLVVLSTSVLALLVLLGLLWAATCARGGDARKKRLGRAAQTGEEEEEDDEEEDETAGVGLTGGRGSGGPNKAAPGAATMLLLKGEEQKKRNKKKPPEKTSRLNGQPAHEMSEEEIMRTVRRDNLKQPSDAEKKTEKSKKNKKKPKGDARTVQDQSRSEGKEIDEGTEKLKPNTSVTAGSRGAPHYLGNDYAAAPTQPLSRPFGARHFCPSSELSFSKNPAQSAGLWGSLGGHSGVADFPPLGVTWTHWSNQAKASTAGSRGAPHYLGNDYAAAPTQPLSRPFGARHFCPSSELSFSKNPAQSAGLWGSLGGHSGVADFPPLGVTWTHWSNQAKARRVCCVRIGFFPHFFPIFLTGDSISSIQVSNSKSGKVDAVLQQGLNEGPTVNGGNWSEKPVKLSSQIGTSEEKWTSVTSAGSKKKTETSAWGKDAGDNGNGKEWGVSLVGRTWGERSLFPSVAAWSGVDGRINTPEQSSASFTSLGLNPAVPGSSSESVSQPGTTDFQWDLNRNQAHIDDEWSGLNGLSPTDPSSDWNAPAEEWGNWVEEEKPPPTPQLEEVLSEVQKVSDEDREKTELTLHSTASGKSKKKKKKKKKQGEEAGSAAQDAEDLERDAAEEFPEDTSKVQQEEMSFSLKTISTSEEAEPEETPTFSVSTEPSVTVSENESDKLPSQVPQMLQETEVPISNVKQNSVPPPQTKSEESWESPKQIKKKKKARRET
ncbi:protein LYRIC [Sphaerodactylus townsendi]|uniref:protein LYRIC n=1 Tax=Sphaerodactylus townsendi TaxID=933632 RepID=UPI0020260F7B|nr:protein LYRIC [Sphaerodactylus townsendi]